MQKNLTIWVQLMPQSGCLKMLFSNGATKPKFVYVSYTDGHWYYTEEGSKRLVIMEEKEKERVLLEYHENPETGRHRGSSSTYNKIVASYYWLGIMEDIKQWVR